MPLVHETRAHRANGQKSATLVAFGAAMRAVRREHELSQEKFASQVGLARSYYGAIERGERVVPISVAERIAGGLEMKLSELLKRAKL